MNIKKYYSLLIILGIAAVALAFYLTAKKSQNMKSYSTHKDSGGSSNKSAEEFKPGKSQPIEMH